MPIISKTMLYLRYSIAAALVSAMAVFLICTFSCSGPPTPAQVDPGAAAPVQAKPSAPPISDNLSQEKQTAQPPGTVTENVTEDSTGGVRIIQVHFRGFPEPLGCCNNNLYERDEFVAIQNTGKTPQNLAGWKLVNANKSWAVFVFPENYPCIAFTPYSQNKYAANTFNYASNAPQALDKIFAPRVPSENERTSQVLVPSEVEWSNCLPPDPLDEIPMKPFSGQEQGFLQPCVLYPGQMVLVFTDEIHCQYGGLSFRYGLGNLWNNEIADTAVLYDSSGREVSRKSYTTGR